MHTDVRRRRSGHEDRERGGVRHYGGQEELDSFIQPCGHFYRKGGRGRRSDVTRAESGIRMMREVSS